jgi:hypothetical protein
MRRTAGTPSLLLLSLSVLAFVLAGCGGGGGGNSSGSGAPATVAVTLTASSGSANAFAGVAADPFDPTFSVPSKLDGRKGSISHVYMDVVSMTLLPSGEAEESGDLEGELDDLPGDGPRDDGDRSRPLTIVPSSPTRIDLLALGDGDRLARFLDRFDSVPAGTYDKIRVKYDNVTVVLDDPAEKPLRFHPTAHSRFDIHFRQGRELVVPAATDTSRPDGWIRFLKVEIDVVGLKLKVIENGRGEWAGKVILRPQVFAKFVPPILYSVAGTAESVAVSPSLPPAGTFDVVFGALSAAPTTVHVAFDGLASWEWSDDVLAASSWTVPVPASLVASSFRDRAVVEVAGSFEGATFRGTDIAFSFPDSVSGTVDNGWRADNTLRLKDWAATPGTVLPADPLLTVFPMLDRAGAWYDNAAAPHLALTDGAVADNVHVGKARGYGAVDGFEAFWFSIGAL